MRPAIHIRIIKKPQTPATEKTQNSFILYITGKADMNERILIVEDDSALLEIMSDFFSGSQYHVTAVNTGLRAVEEVDHHVFDMILLDVNLPDMDGFEVCRYIRSSVKERTPVLFITARASEIDKLNGYASGGDDYITKPFSLLVMNAKIQAILNRTGKKENIFKAGALEINRENHILFNGHTSVQLAPKEYELLIFLAENEGRLYSRDALLTRLWGYDYEGSERVVDDHIRKLRKALGKHAGYIETVRKSGYRFVIEEED